MLSFRSRKAVPLNYIIVETVFGELFRLPHVSSPEVFYGVLLIELSRECPDSMPLIVSFWKGRWVLGEAHDCH